jgi:hypothetical protein
MSRGHVQTRVSEQIRTLFQAGLLGGLTDAQLLERYLSPEGPGSETAFTALVERHGPMALASAAGCSLTRTLPKTPSRPRF